MSISLLMMLAGQGFTVFETAPLTSRGTDTYYTTTWETTYNTNKATDTVYNTNVLTNTNKNTVTLFQTQTIYGTNYPTQRGTNFITNYSTNTVYPTYWWVSTYFATQYTRNTQFNQETSQSPVGYGAIHSYYNFDSRHAYVTNLYSYYLGRDPDPGGYAWFVSTIEANYGSPDYPTFDSLGAILESYLTGGETRPTLYSINTVYDVDTWFPTQYAAVTNRDTTTVFQTDWITYFETFYSNFTSHLTGTSRNTDTIYNTLTIYNTNKSTTTIYDTTIETSDITYHNTTTVFTTVFGTQRFTGIDDKTSEGLNEQP